MYYELYIDILFLVNFMMDYILLLLIKKILKCTATLGNISLGALTGALLTCLVVALPIPWPLLKILLFHGVVNILMLKIALRLKWDKKLWKALFFLYITSFLLGGILEHVRQYVEIGSLFFVLAVGCYYISSGIWKILDLIFKTGQCRCDVELYVNGRCVTVPALIDTGNTLRDKLTGKPVNIIESQTAEELFGKEIPEGIRYISYHTIGRKNAVMPVAVLDSLRIAGENEKWVDKPMVGISEEKISSDGEYRMIINPDT
ncbi:MULTISPECIES: sigma-E processing peptidase SpoIIGA [Claveliimonas]|uniref:sigma-E processing peptidase SpoIIGA n=1 Tax=Claveliimonas TaxID=3076670 RepID=UPI00292F3539|nr:sigma-E processing peptidase SpoIIGA [Claveliimonas bilis]BDZ78983.1 sporulation sigma-E factor-processing peptidase [Claveliimonas bilis]